MEEKFVEINEVRLCTQAFGSSENECVLLIMGATASMLYWDDEFCIRLAQQGFFVIRYDNRDVGSQPPIPWAWPLMISLTW
jgi:alpha-beta hydrolase superfamily lysophospholipase